MNMRWSGWHGRRSPHSSGWQNSSMNSASGWMCWRLTVCSGRRASLRMTRPPPPQPLVSLGPCAVLPLSDVVFGFSE